MGGQRVSLGPIPTGLGSARPFPKGVHHGESEELSPPTPPGPPIHPADSLPLLPVTLLTLLPVRE